MNSRVLTLLILLPATAPAVTWENQPYRTRTTPAVEVPLQAMRLTVPEDPARPGGPQVELAVFRLPTANPRPAAPVVYLHGGPGGSSVEHLESPEFREVFAAFQQEADVILFDQRGCGQSQPSLLPAGGLRMGEDTLTGRATFLAFLEEASQGVRDRLTAAGHDPGKYTLPQSVADIEALRRALGVERISLFGHSYGAQLAQDYLRRHPEGVDRVVLAGARGMDTTRKLPAEADEFLARIAELARADATVGGKFPDLLATLDRVLGKLDRKPVAVELEGPDGRYTLKVGGYALRFVIAKFYLNDPENFRYLPKLLDELDTGRRPWSLVFNLMQMQRGAVSFAWFTTDAASGVTPARADLIRRQAASARLQDAMNFPFPDINRAWNVADLGDEFRAAVSSDRPVLLVAGTLDGITPVAQSREILRGFSAGRLLVVENGGHNSMFRAPGLPAALAGFLAGREPPDSAVLPPAPFMPLVAARK